jgi:CcmD family protein
MPPETPQNGEYLVAAYVVTVVILVGYFWSLLRRTKKVLKGT